MRRPCNSPRLLNPIASWSETQGLWGVGSMAPRLRDSPLALWFISAFPTSQRPLFMPQVCVIWVVCDDRIGEPLQCAPLPKDLVPYHRASVVEPCIFTWPFY